MLPQELMVKQFVAELNGSSGARLRVYETGSSRHYLFELIRCPACSMLLGSVAQRRGVCPRRRAYPVDAT